MSFNLSDLETHIQAHGAVVRVLVASTKGSAPRDAGATMQVWHGGQSGTIGGGALEHQASLRAREMLTQGTGAMHITQPLGPTLGQCCGGSVTLVFERFSAENLPTTLTRMFTRPVAHDASADIPALLQRRINAAQKAPISPTLTAGWLAESITQNTTPIWIFGAGHVGEALARNLAPLAGFDITVIDTEPARIPADLPQNITVLTAQNMAALAKHAPDNAQHFIMTMDHAIDLDLCHRLLGKASGFIGLIGSKTKWARFQSRLKNLGHTAADIQRITCPIGNPNLGKEPQAIAVGITHALLLKRTELESSTDIYQGQGT
ncbi:hypothetical protein JI58_03515 [Marinosulfonomonas sp. PRT-SC04]|nr:hypothetical protein JI58_03515 [Marinosulfonomonas sp. PRT-SC04]